MIKFLWRTWIVAFITIILLMGMDIWSFKQKHTYALSVRESYMKSDMEENYPIQIEGDVWKGNNLYAHVYYLLVPERIRHSFQDEGWKIILTDKNISDHYYTGEVEGWLSGLTDYSKKRIYIHSRFYDIRNALLHEMGHYYDYMLGGASYTDEFKEIYEEENNQLKPYWEPDSHIRSNAQEYFAEAFADYILDKEQVKENVKSTYKFIRTYQVPLTE